MYVIVHNASPLFGGGELWNARLLAGLQRRGHKVLALYKKIWLGPVGALRLRGGRRRPRHGLRGSPPRSRRPSWPSRATTARARMGAAAALRARRDFSYERMLDEWEAALLSRRGSRRE